jgi:hypothetical protein
MEADVRDHQNWRTRKDKTMNQFKLLGFRNTAILTLISTFMSLTVAAQQTVKVEGLIKGRSGESMIVQTKDNHDLVVELTNGDVQGSQ